MIDYPNKLNIIFDKLLKNGAIPIIIGGFIRDNLLKRKSKDIDIEIYNISSFTKLEFILREFGTISQVGKSFGVCKLKYIDIELDFTLPRTDSKVNLGHKGFDVSINPTLDFKSAFSRRDFTINAIGYNILEKKIIDPFNGIKDLNNKVLKAVNEDSFTDDPLRVLRAIQFCARFDLTIDKNLLKLSKQMIKNDMLDELSKDRIFGEFKKLLLKAKKPSIGLYLLKEIGAVKYFFSSEHVNNFHSTLKIIDNMKELLTSNKKTNLILMLSSTCYDYSSLEVEEFIKNLTNEKEILNRVTALVQNIKYIDLIYDNGLKKSELFKLATKVNIQELLLLNEAVNTSNIHNSYEITTIIKKRVIELDILNKKLEPLLKGRDILSLEQNLSFKIEAKNFSNILNKAYEAQMNSEFSSYNEAIIWLKNYLLK